MYKTVYVSLCEAVQSPDYNGDHKGAITMAATKAP